MKISKKILSLSVALVLLVTSVSFPVSAQSASDFQDRIDYWEDYISKNEAGEEDVQKLLDALDEQNSAISSKIAAKEKEIYPLRTKVNALRTGKLQQSASISERTSSEYRSSRRRDQGKDSHRQYLHSTRRAGRYEQRLRKRYPALRETSRECREYRPR